MVSPIVPSRIMNEQGGTDRESAMMEILQKLQQDIERIQKEKEAEKARFQDEIKAERERHQAELEAEKTRAHVRFSDELDISKNGNGGT